MKPKLVDRDLGWKRVVELGRALSKESYVKVGILADDQEGGLHEEDAALTLAELAAVLTYGTEDGHIPPRPFIQPVFDARREEMVKMAAVQIRHIMDGKQTVEGALGVLGLYLSNEIKKYVTTGEGVPPPNAPATVQAKGSSRPLVDTARMINATTHAVFIAGAEKKGETE